MSLLSLEAYAELSARMIGLTTAERCAAIVRAAGISQAAWEAANAEWSARLARDAALAKRHRRLLTEALRRDPAAAKTISLDDYVALNASVRLGAPIADALRAHGHDLRSFSASSYEWIERFEADPWLEVTFGLRVEKTIAERAGGAERVVGAVYGPGELVRARRCHHCGARKVTRPSTAYVYCDYCATLFDYDPSVTVEDRTSLDPDLVDERLARVTKDALQRAYAARDQAEYARIVRFTSSVLTEVCPAAYSPRIRDPTYREVFHRDLIAPWAVVTRFDAGYCERAAVVAKLRRAATGSRRWSDVLALLDHSREAFTYEVALLDRTGVLAAHPDGLDALRFVHVNLAVFVRPWLAILDAREQLQLLDAAGVRCDYVPLEQTDLAPCACGSCGQKLAIPTGSRRFVCERCGHVLESGARVFACADCGASVCLPAGATQARCGYCDARWTL